MAGKRHDEGRVCLCDRPDGSCAGLAVRRLSSDRVQELAEEIWTASSGELLPARPGPTRGLAGRLGQAAYVRRRAQERQSWRPALGWLVLTWGLIGAAPLLPAGGGCDLGGLAGLAGGPAGGGPGLVAAAFRPSAEVGIWQQQAAMQRRTAGSLAPLADEGYLVLHDVTLPGLLDSLEHLVVGPSGVWVLQSWQRRGRPPVPPCRPGSWVSSSRTPRPSPRCWTAGPRCRSSPCCACTAPGWEPGPRAAGTSGSQPPGSSPRSSALGRRWRPARRLSGPPAASSRCCGRRPDQQWPATRKT